MTATNTRGLRRLGVLSLLAALGAGGCAGGQTGGEFGAEEGTGGEGGGGTLHGDESGNACEETLTELALDETSPLGFAAADVLALAEGTHEATLTWAPDESATATTTLEPGTTEVALVVEAAGPASFVDAAPPSSGDSGGTIDLAWDCPDRVAVPVTVTLTTADGALDETLDGTLSATSAGSAELVLPVDLDELEGTLSFEVVSPEGGVPTQTTLEVVFGEGIFAGRLGGTIVKQTSQVAMATSATYAEWGYGACERDAFPVDPQSPGAITGEMLLDVVNGTSPLAVTWGDGTETTLTLTAASGDPAVCLRPANERLGYPDAVYLLAAEATLLSADGRLDAVQTIAIEATAAEGSPTALTLRSASVQPVEPAEFADVYGLSGVDLGDATDAYLTLEIQVLVEGDAATAEGALTVFGTPPTDCVDTETSTCGFPGWQPIEVMPVQSGE